MLIDTKHADSLTTIRCNREDKLNAFNREMLLELQAALDAARSRSETRVVILAANGRAFCTGADLTIDAAEAHRLGLVNRVVARDQLDDAAHELAETLTRRSPLALAAVKRAVNVGSEMDLQHGMTYALQEFAPLFAGSDQEEGMSAFLEKREPRFRGS